MQLACRLSLAGSVSWPFRDSLYDGALGVLVVIVVSMSGG
jgi:hypothetical protein